MTHYNVCPKDVADALCRGFESDPAHANYLAERKQWARDGFEGAGINISESADRCLDKFIDSELDYATPGNRGLGRFVEIIPRLAGRHRTVISRLSDQQRLELGTFIKRHMACGYLIAAQMVNVPNVRQTEEQLYASMVLCVSSQPFPLFPDRDCEAQAQLLHTCTKNELQHELSDLGVAWGDTDDLISYMYFVVGMALRVLETVPPEEIQKWQDSKFATMEQMYQASKANDSKPSTGCLLLVAGFLATLAAGVAVVFVP
jgi:hypothetical protein